MAAAGDIQRFRAILDGEEYELAWRPGATLLECMLAEGLDPALGRRAGGLRCLGTWSSCAGGGAGA